MIVSNHVQHDFEFLAKPCGPDLSVEFRRPNIVIFLLLAYNIVILVDLVEYGLHGNGQLESIKLQLKRWHAQMNINSVEGESGCSSVTAAFVRDILFSIVLQPQTVRRRTRYSKVKIAIHTVCARERTRVRVPCVQTHMSHTRVYMCL